jgi:prolyl 4-hydroxylase
MKLELGNYEMEMIYHDPKVYAIKGLLSDLECSHFQKIAKQNLKRSRVSGFDKDNNKKGLMDERRTSSQCWIKLSHDHITTDVAVRISKLANIPLSHAESFQVVHYAISQEYQPHLDTFDPEVNEYRPYLENGGQRISTAICYLNNVEEGGETIFPNLSKTVKPEKGKIIVFDNCYKNSDKPHLDSLHGGLPVLRGEKWIVNLWFRKNSRINEL